MNVTTQKESMWFNLELQNCLIDVLMRHNILTAISCINSIKLTM